MMKAKKIHSEEMAQFWLLSARFWFRAAAQAARTGDYDMANAYHDRGAECIVEALRS